MHRHCNVGDLQIELVPMANLPETIAACACQKTKHEPHLIVLTGGPGAGKTAILELAKRHFCEHVAILPESASIVFGGGFLRKATMPGRKAAQRAIFHVQRELEALVIEEAVSAVALCDRGTLDGIAYWPNSADSFFQELGIKREEELKRYAAVIHLRTPPAHQGYNHQNPMRIETPLQAAEIDQKIFDAWKGHPNQFTIESTRHFLTKATKAIELIRQQIPECCVEAVTQ